MNIMVLSLSAIGIGFFLGLFISVKLIAARCKFGQVTYRELGPELPLYLMISAAPIVGAVILYMVFASVAEEGPLTSFTTMDVVIPSSVFFLATVAFIALHYRAYFHDNPVGNSRLVQWAIDPHLQPTFWDLSSDQQKIYLAALDEARIGEEKRKDIFVKGAITNERLSARGGSWIPEVIYCEAKRGGRVCMRPAGHLDSHPMHYHTMNPTHLFGGLMRWKVKNLK